MLYLYCGSVLQAQPVPQPLLVAELCPGETPTGSLCGGAPYFMQTFRGKMMLAGWDGQRGNLYSYDGERLTMYSYPNVSLEWPSYRVLGDDFYFTNYYNYPASRDKEIFRWDGFSKPVRITYINLSGNSNPGELEALNGKLYFTATDGTSDYSLWQYDPVKNTSVRISPYAADGTMVYNGTLYFVADDPVLGREFFMLDPETGKTKVVADINEGSAGSNPQSFTRANGKLYFTAISAAYGRELYMFDGTTIPARLTDIAPGSGNGIGSANGADMTFVDGKLYFTGSTTGNLPFDLWAYDVATNKYDRAAALFTSDITDARSFTAYHNKVAFPAKSRQHNANHVYVYDPQYSTLKQMPDPFFSQNFTAYLQYVYNDVLYLSAESSNYGWELYSYRDTVQADTFKPVLYPNPATDNVFIKMQVSSTRALTVTITNAVGQIVTRRLLGTYEPGEHILELPLTHIAPGLYFCTLYDNFIGELWTDKLVKR